MFKLDGFLGTAGGGLETRYYTRIFTDSTQARASSARSRSRYDMPSQLCHIDRLIWLEALLCLFKDWRKWQLDLGSCQATQVSSIGLWVVDDVNIRVVHGISAPALDLLESHCLFIH